MLELYVAELKKNAGYDEAVRKGYVTGNVKLFHNGVMYDIT